MVYLTTSQAGPEPFVGRGAEKKPVVAIGHACSGRADVAGKTSGCDVVSFGAMAELWDDVPLFEPDAQGFDPETLFDGVQEDGGGGIL